MKIQTAPKSVMCPTCKGSGEQNIECRTISPGKPVEISVTKITCVICKGAKVISQKVKRALKREADLWCRCKTSSESPDFHDDNECSQCQKHHWHCGNCRKICQVG